MKSFWPYWTSSRSRRSDWDFVRTWRAAGWSPFCLIWFSNSDWRVSWRPRGPANYIFSSLSPSLLMESDVTVREDSLDSEREVSTSPDWFCKTRWALVLPAALFRSTDAAWFSFVLIILGFLRLESDQIVSLINKLLLLFSSQ